MKPLKGRLPLILLIGAFLFVACLVLVTLLKFRGWTYDL